MSPIENPSGATLLEISIRQGNGQPLWFATATLANHLPDAARRDAVKQTLAELSERLLTTHFPE